MYWYDFGTHTVVVIYRDNLAVRYEAWRKRRDDVPATMIDGFDTLAEAKRAVMRDQRGPVTAPTEQASLL